MPAQFDCPCGYTTHRKFNLKRHRLRKACVYGKRMDDHGDFDASASNAPPNSIDVERQIAKTEEVIDPNLAAKRLPPPVVRDGNMGIRISSPASHGPAIRAIVEESHRNRAMLSPPGTPVPPKPSTAVFFPGQAVPQINFQVPLEQHEKVLNRVRELEAWQKRVKRDIKFLLTEIEDE